MLELKVSVRNLVEFILRSGDIDTGYMRMNRALEGTKAHRKIQKSYGDNYSAEVQLKKTIVFDSYSLTIEGRADGIIIEDSDIIIDEIKSVTVPLELIDESYNIAHWAQAICYGYIYCEENDLDKLIIQLTYIQLDTEEIKRIRKNYSIDGLKEFFDDLIRKYCAWADMNNSWIITRDKSIKSLSFPFPSYRKDQKKMAASVYRSIRDENTLFVQAPTGIGKTISAIFPSVIAMGQGLTSKIFYLTAKTTTQKIAEETLNLMKQNGLKLITITITAKDKICFMEERNCNPKHCKYAKGHFDRVNDAIMDMFKNEENINREILLKYAEKHKVCPFEYSLDLSLWADCVICDYNYLFDPNASLKRFFSDKKTDFTFLMDEAHNLADRGREMFSAELHKSNFLELKRYTKDKNKKLYAICNSINKYFLDIKKKLDENNYYTDYKDEKELYPLLHSFINVADKYLAMSKNPGEEHRLMEIYFNVLNYLKISELYDDHYCTYIEKQRNDMLIKLFCLDPSSLLRQVLKKGRAGVFFSATLLPMDYFFEILGGEESNRFIYLNSPFNVKNRCLLLGDNVQTRYNKRENSYSQIAEYINKAVITKMGNYIVYFPSYKYLEKVHEEFTKMYPDYTVNVQSPGMTEDEKSSFIDFFQPNPDTHNIGFCVLGGVYSEGIDLIADRLIGVIIVGVGLPQLCFERDIIKSYFDDKNNKGFEYSYMYPGMNKVLQAAGRLIRTESDRGVILLLDERFSRRDYQRLFPKEWFPHKKVKENMIGKVLEEFWGFGLEEDNP